MATKPENLVRILAPVLVGSVLSCISAGLVLSLATTYFTRFNSDACWVKLAVLSLTVLALVGSGSDVSWLYNWSVTHFLHPERLSSVPWELSAYHFLNGFIVAFVQHLYLFRCWVVSGRTNFVRVVFASTTSIASFGVSTYLTVLSSQNRELEWPAHLRNVSWAWYAGALTVDIFILATMLDHLVFRPRIGKPTVIATRAATATTTLNGPKPVKPSRGRTWSNRILHSNAVPLVVQSLVLALFAVRTNGLQYLVFAFFAPKIYVVSLLATLNSRSPHGNGALDPIDSTFTLACDPFQNPRLLDRARHGTFGLGGRGGTRLEGGAGGAGGRGGLPTSTVRVVVEHEQMVDLDTLDGVDDDEGLGRGRGSSTKSS